MSWASPSLSRNSSQSSIGRNYNPSAQGPGPFCAPAVNSNPNFRPGRVCLGPNDGYKAPKAPEKPLMPYMRYSRRMWDRVRSTHPDLKFWEIGKIIGKMWRELTDKEKQAFCDEYEMEKAEYDRMMTSYHNSTAFQSYLAQKNRDKSETVMPMYYDYQGVYVQPLDEETDDAEWNNVRYSTSERFNRNHVIMNEILSPTPIPDLRSVITTERVNVLRSQVTSLTVHQETLESEYKQLIENYEKRKRRIEESRAWFEKRLKQVLDEKPDFNDQAIERLTEKWKKKYLEAYERQRKMNDNLDEQHRQERQQSEESETTKEEEKNEEDECRE